MNKVKYQPPQLPKLIFAILLCLSCLYPAMAQSERPFLHPDRIRYDGQCLTIDGKDMFIYSGSFHYFRCPKELWPDRFQKIKDAGFNTVETYVPWNWCERQMPDNTNDFSKVDLKDFDDWLTMAEQFGFYIIVRPGPYICAEWDTGGYPQWLLAKKPENPLRSEGWLRSDDPVYLSWSKHWYDAVCPVIAKHQITRKAPGQPGVILVQVENEYDYAHFPDDVKINQVKALAEYARADGIDVPLITCWTHQVRGSTDPVLRQIFDCCNFYPRWAVEDTGKDIRKLRSEQPDAPLATTELQGGWFAQVGGKLSQDQDGLTGAQINNLTLFAIQNGETILNYYMLFGGTNPDDWAARDITTTYDYDAPIREWGGVGDRYQRVWAIGHFLQEYGAKLSRAEKVDCKVTTSQDDVTVVDRKAQDGSQYFFVRTSQNREPRNGTATVSSGSGPDITFDYQLEPFGFKIFYLPPGITDPSSGEWFPKEASPIERPTNLPAGITIASAKTQADPGPAHWNKLKPGEPLAQAGVNDSHFIYYRAEVSCATDTNLQVEYPDGDAVLARINGKPAAEIGGIQSESRFGLQPGKNAVLLLYENHGHANGGTIMENASGILAARTTASSALADGTPIKNWRMNIVDGTKNRPEVQPGFSDTSWKPVAADDINANQLIPNQDAVFRSEVELTPTELNGAQMILTFGRVDDVGWIYVNGNSIGKTTDWSRSYSFDITKSVHPGHNLIAVVVRNVGGGGGIGLPSLSTISDDPPVPLKSYGRPAGDEKQWWTPDFNDTDWSPVTIGQTVSGSENSLLTWYRMNFSLPSPQAGVWVPWRLHLMAGGNGFLYLNGHPLGRYWNVGPQHDFFLPECWLHFGDGQSNNLTLELRPTENGTGIQSAVVEPYSDFAEKR